MREVERRKALITGGSRGLGRATAAELARRGWTVVITGRNGAVLQSAADAIGGQVTAIAGDVSDPQHRHQLKAAVGEDIDLIINNASTLGLSPLRSLEETAEEQIRRVFEVNVIAPAALLGEMLPAITRHGVVVNISSDAAIEAYPTWGVYGASKAALDHISAVLAAERPELSVYAFDPGDMRTDMHQAAFPGEDISDRPEPETVVPALMALVEERPPSGRYAAADLLTQVG